MPHTPIDALPIDIPAEALAEFCRARHIVRLRLFGSVLREDFTPQSDVDVLVDFEPGAHVSLLDVVRWERELSALISRKVDLLTEGDISKYFIDEVLREARTIYATP